MYQETRIANVHVLLSKIGEFLEDAPANEKEQVNWDELSQKRDNAWNSLDLLCEMFGQKDVTTACEGERPEQAPVPRVGPSDKCVVADRRFIRASQERSTCCQQDGTGKEAEPQGTRGALGRR